MHIISGQLKYEIHFQEYKNDENQIEIVKVFFGPRKHHCVVVSVYLDESDPDYVFAELEGIGYKSLCSTNGSLPRGHGTIDMLKSAMAFIFTEYQFLQGIKLKDTSSIDCGKGKNLDLLSFEMAKRGVSWYSFHFNAHCETHKDQKMINNLPQKMNNAFLKYKGNFNQFYTKYIIKHKSDDIFMRTETKPLLKHVFDGSSTFSQFINNVIKTDGLKCEALLYWLNDYVHKLGSFESEMHWIIDRPQILHHITIDRSQQGGNVTTLTKKTIKQIWKNIDNNGRKKQLIG